MKRLLVLLVLLAGGLVAAALSVPSNAAVVNGTAISQQSLNADVSAIAGSASYQCYLNSQEYLSSQGTSQLPPVVGAGTGQNPGDHPTATSAFVASYLDSEIGHQLVYQLAAKRGVSVTQAQLADARSNLSAQISAVMSEVSQSAEGQNPRYTCSVSGAPLTGEEVLATLPSSFVNQQVQFLATATALQADLAGVGAREADLQRYWAAHRRQFDTVCFNAAVYQSEDAAKAAVAAVAFGTPFSQVASGAAQSGVIPCSPLASVAAELGVPAGDLEGIAVGQVSAPIAVNGSYIVAQLSRRTPTTFAQAKTAVTQAVERAGAAATQRVLAAAERHASVSVSPQYGVWVPATATVFTPLTPNPTDVLNASANEAGTSLSSASPSSG